MANTYNSTRPTPPAGYSYCTPTCYCRDCRRMEANLRAEAVAAASKPIRRADGYVEILATFTSRCNVCAQPMNQGERIAYIPRTPRTSRHIACRDSQPDRTCWECGAGTLPNDPFVHDGHGWIHRSCNG